MKYGKLRFAFYLFILVMSSYTLRAQTDQNAYSLQNVVPPSPNAASLGKYVDWPVNLYTGLTQVSVPIYELKGRTMSVPISLSYHASGIKVGEQASSVGLGWSLQGGGVITRSLRGLPDEEDGSGYLSVRSQYNDPGDLSQGSSPSTIDSLTQWAIINGNSDSEPDLFMFSALGKSYKFYFAGNGTIVTQPYSNLKITMNTPNDSWSVIMEDGTILEFGGSGNFSEVSNSDTRASSITYTSSWYLNTITTTNGETIHFTYTAGGEVEVDSYLYQADYQLNNIPVNILSSGAPVTTKSASNRSQTQSINFVNLASIETDLGKVYFDKSSRIDLPGAMAITGIRVFSKLTNSLVKSFALRYGYSTAASGNVFTSGYTSSPYRLKLDTLEEIPIDNGPHKYWQFAYNPTPLPSRKSYAQDYWGYYNGATSNTTLLPLVIGFNPDRHPYGNRSADSLSMMAEMLTKVTYATGGYSQFNYEPNSYPTSEERFTPSSNSLNLYLTYDQSNFTNIQTNTITITKPQYFNFQFRGVFSAKYLADFGTSTTLASAVLKDNTGTIVSFIGLRNANNGITYTAPSVLLNPGTYTFTISSISSQDDFGSTSENVALLANYTYQASLGYSIVNHPLGGVRIKSIFYYDNVDSTKSIKKYYQYENAFVVSPIDSAIDYSTTTTDNMYDCSSAPDNITDCGLPGCLATSVVYNTRYSSTKFALGSIQGGPVGYGKVTEKFGPNAENGKKVYYYSYVSDQNTGSSKVLPYPETISLDYERGLLTEEDTYTSGGALIDKTQNTYQFLNKGSIKTYKVAYRFSVLSGCVSYYLLSDIFLRTYYTDQTNQVQQTSTTQTAYNTATNDSFVTSTNYYYTDTLNMMPTRTTIFNSKGDSIVIYKRTVLEKADINNSITLSPTASQAIDSMKARNIISIPIELEKYTQNTLTNKVLSNYKLQSSGLVLPDNVMVQNASNVLETRIYFPRYDVKGNLLEQFKSSGEKHDYIWDYQYTYPIAEVANGDSVSIAATSFEADGSGNWSISSVARDSVTPAITGYKSYNLTNGSISTSLALSSGKTYILSYWSTNSSFTVTSGGTPKQGKTISVNGASWTYYEHTISGVTGITISGSGNIDELRLYPSTAQMSTNTYLPLIGVTSQCDINNRINYYQYDGFNRLYTILDQDRNVLKKYCYNYVGQSIACQQYTSGVKSGTFTRNNCGSGYTGDTVTYTVPANKYSSLVSQTVADSLAQNDVNTNGQAYANANGSCTFSGYTITATNNASISGFTVTFTNTSTSVQTVFNIPSDGGTLGTLAAGTYNVTMAISGKTKYIYTVCTSTHASAVSSTFYSITVGSSCNTVQVDTVN